MSRRDHLKYLGFKTQFIKQTLMDMNNTQLPAEVLTEIKQEATDAMNKEEVRLKTNNPHLAYGPMISRLNGFLDGYISCATECATKLLQAQQENEAKEKLALDGFNHSVQNIKMRYLLEKVIYRHEGGLLPDRLLYNEIKTFLG